MENYEEKYKEALELARESLTDGLALHSPLKDVIELIFPELRESEDERIRKAIIDSVTFKRKLTDAEQKDCLSWLEKQGEVKESVISQHENKTCKENDDSLTSENERIRNLLIDIVKVSSCGRTLKDVDKSEYHKCLAWLEKQGEQKPAEWSEEDERMCQETIDWFEKKCFPYALESENPARESIKWLKSLKPQSHWKPSEEQMEALKKRTIGLHTNSEIRKVLESLIFDLESLI